MWEFIAIFVWLLSGGIAGGIYCAKSDDKATEKVAPFLLSCALGPVFLGAEIGKCIARRRTPRAPDGVDGKGEG